MRVLLFILLGLISACAGPQIQQVGDARQAATLSEDVFVTEDGLSLAVQAWESEEPLAILIGLHGMNDYSKTFAMPGPWLAERGITTYAYDQRGFGKSPGTGIWAGNDVMRQDARSFISLIKSRHPDLPVYVMGVSMGGAVAISALAENSAEVDGLILVAPAVWGWSVMNPFYKASLWLSAHLFPGWSPTGSSLEIWPSDNIEMLRDNYKDPLVIKETRIDAVYGLVGLMDEGYLGVDQLSVPTLLLYGEKDEIIPRGPFEDVAKRVPSEKRIVIYEKGYHMLLRDLQRERVWADIASWVRTPDVTLPSGEAWIP